MDTLSEIKDLIEITEILEDLDWAMEMIGSNKLYDPVYNNKGGEVKINIFKYIYKSNFINYNNIK